MSNEPSAEPPHWTLLPHLLCDSCEAPLESSRELRCSACSSSFYCSKECQKIHWKKDHKQMCSILMSVKTAYDAKKVAEAVTMPERLAKQAEARGAECGVCFDKMDAPLILACNHVYCLKCLFEHTSNNRRDCPTCRQDMLGGPDRPALHHYIYASAADFLRRAKELEKGSPERAEMCEMTKTQLAYLPSVRQLFLELFESFRALPGAGVDDADIDQMIVSFQSQYNSVDIVSQMTQGEVHMCEGDFARATHVLERLLTTSSSRAIERVVPKSRGSLHLLLAEALFETGDYEKAQRYAQEAAVAEGSGFDDMGREIHESAVNQRKIMHVLGKCSYHLGELDKAVEILELSLHTNRYYEDIYQDLAKCYEALNEMDNARLVMEKAVKYQLPWQPEIRERNKQQLAKYLQSSN